MPLDFIIPPGYGVLQPIQVQPPSSSTAARQQPSVTEGGWLNWYTSAKYNQHWKGSIPLSVVSCWQSQLFVNLLKSFDPHSLCQTKCFMESVMHSKCNQLSRLQPTKQYNCPTNGVHLFFFRSKLFCENNHTCSKLFIIWERQLFKFDSKIGFPCKDIFWW